MKCIETYRIVILICLLPVALLLWFALCLILGLWPEQVAGRLENYLNGAR